MTSPSVGGPGVILIGLVLALPLLVALPFLVLVAYKRSLRRLMRRTNPAQQPQPTDAPLQTQASAPQQPSNIEPSPDRLHLAHTRQLCCALAYAVAGACCSAALALTLMGEAGVRRPVAFLTILAFDLWPVLLSVSLILRWNRTAWLRFGAAYFGVLVLLAALQHLRGGSVSLPRLLLFFLLLNGPPTFFVRAISLKSIRQIGPTLLPFCLAIVIGPQELLHFGATHFSIAHVIARTAILLGIGNGMAILFGAVATLVLMALLGSLIAALLVALYRSQYLSDQSLLLDSLWIVFVGIHALVMLTRTGNETGSGEVWIVVALPLYLVAINCGLRIVTLRRRRAGPAGTSLLVLRAFTLQQRAEAVFLPLTTLWRYLGPVRLIGGADLAATTIEPGTFLEYVCGALPSLFLQSASDLNRRMRQPAASPDPDGRFRVYDFFCFDDVWRLAVRRLILESDVILADFRGLSQGDHAGCEWEVQELARSSGLAKCVFLLDAPPLDKPSDADRLRTVLANSPMPPDIPPRIIQGDHRNADDLLSALLHP